MQEKSSPDGSQSLEELIEQALSYREPIKKPQTEQIRPQSLLEKIVLSKWTAPVSAAALGTYFYKTVQISETVDSTDKAIQAAMSAGLSYLTASLLRQDWLIRKAETVQRRFRSLPSKFLGFFAEHPERIAGGIAAYATARLVSPMFTSITPSDFFRHLAVVPIALDLSAYIFSTIFAMSYPAASLALGRVFHQETFKTAFQASAAAINAWRGGYKAAAENLAKLLQTQRSYSKAVKLQTLIGDLQLLGQDFKCFDTYTGAISTEKTDYVGRSDGSLEPFISLIGGVVKHRKKPEWAGAKDISYVISGAHAFAKGKKSDLAAADTAFRLAVTSQRDSIIAHTARATFLRATGQHRTADLEMIVRAEQVMSDPDAEREVVEGRNRNIVFFSGNVAVKQNKDKKPIEDEQRIVGKFRQQFGSSVIYPLPVYERDGLYHFLSEKVVSETLLGLIRQRKARLEDFAQALEQMAQLQRFGKELYTAGELPLDDSILRIDPSKPDSLYFMQRRLRAIGQVERFNGVRMPESYKAALGPGGAFIDRALAKSRLLTMYKDYGPKNVLKRLFGQMQALDFELSSLRLLPPQMDFINLTESESYLSPTQLLWLRSVYILLQERENKSKIDREEFEMINAFSGFQWHYERLIYSTAETATARTEEQREEKKKDQVRHLLKARVYMDTIIEKKYVDGDDLAAALRAMEELKRPIFADPAEQNRLEELVLREQKEATLKEALPASNARLAFASVGAMAVLAVSVLGAVSIRNNLVPVLNVPVFPQGDKILLTVSETDDEGRWREGPGKVKYFVIDAEHDTVSFLTDADNTASADLSAFQDKAVFIKDGKITLYDFLNREFRSVTDERFKNPAISPDGLWIASNVRMKYIDPVMTELWLIRPSNMHTRKITDFPNAFLPYHSASKSWSPDGSYLAFLSNNEKAEGRSYPDSFKVWINTLELSSGRVYQGPFVGYRGRGVFAWSPNGSLTYLTEQKGEQQRIYISDPRFENVKEVHVSSDRDLSGILSVGPENLAIESFEHLLLLNLPTLKTAAPAAAAGGYIEDVSKSGNRFLYECNTPFDVCEFDLETGKSVNLTNTPGRRELSAVYAPNQRKVYVVSYPAVNCIEQGCPPSLSVIDLATGKSQLLMNDEKGSLRYTLIPP